MTRALAHRNFRLFFGGQSVSLVGTWMQQTAMTWLVYRLTQSSAWLGLIGFSLQIPSFFVAPLAGVLADRWNRHRVVVLTQTLAMLQALVLAALVLTGVVAVWHLLILSILLGVVNAVDMTVRQAFLTEMVDKREDLANAIALNSTMVNATRLIGPAVGGLVVSAVGEGMCFLFNGLSYVAVLIALLSMQLKPRPRQTRDTRVLQDLHEGFLYVYRFTPIRSILLLLALVSLVGLPYSVLMPVYANKVLGGDARTLGFLLAASGFGALAGALCLAFRKSVLGLGRWIALAPSAFGLAIIGFAFSRVLATSLCFLAAAGFAVMVQLASSNTILQTIVDEDKRGRVMSFYTLAFVGMTPLGSLLAGSLAEKVSVQYTLVGGGVCCIAGSLLFIRHLSVLRVWVRPIYTRMGILPPVASGVQAATNLQSPPEQ